VKYQSKAAEYRTDSVRGSLRVGNQIEECEAHDQEDDEPLDPRHVGLLILYGLHQRLFGHPAACTGRSLYGSSAPIIRWLSLAMVPGEPSANLAGVFAFDEVGSVLTRADRASDDDRANELDDRARIFK
jgi:hypothetical protein